MKFFLVALLFLIPILSRGQAVKFKDVSLSEIIETAKAEKKFVFLIYGFNKCGYGMKSFHELQSDTIINDFMNSNFISVILSDSYNENEFEALFSIMDFPRYFFFSPEGELVMMRSTYHSPNRIRKQAQRVLKGKIVRPNILMYAGKAYPKNRKTLKMLSHTMNAYLILNRNGFSFTDRDSFSGITLDEVEKSDFDNEINRSFDSGEYFINKLLRDIKIAVN
jgi:thioredoxin-related protein